MAQADIGLIGLAVMGENLVLNMANHGFSVAVYNRTTSKVDRFLEGRAAGKSIVGAHSPEELVQQLASPRKIMIMVKAGKPVDLVIDGLVPLLDAGDILIDGGNSYYADTVRRTRSLQEKGIRFIGTGVSGGEEGALKGPSIMPGGDPDAWPHLKEIFQGIAAKVGDGVPCCEWVGNDGAGHYVKMVHNGIEYGDMQMICEAYDLLREVLGMSPAEIGEVFSGWDNGVLDSYLIEITSEILKTTDEQTGKPMVDVILDKAGQKGTGKWTSGDALDLGAPAATIAEAVFARCLSAVKEERVAASQVLRGPEPNCVGERDAFIRDVEQCLYASKICSYAQGFQLLEMAAAEYGWQLNFGSIALMWRGGCIIRARFLDDINRAFEADPDLANLLVAPFFLQAIDEAQAGWRRTVSAAVRNGVPVPTFSSALAYYDGYRRETLPASLLQAQRDYFGAHTYERVDQPRGEFFHTNWTGEGGDTASSAYNV